MQRRQAMAGLVLALAMLPGGARAEGPVAARLTPAAAQGSPAVVQPVKAAAAPLEIRAAVLRIDTPGPLPISRLDLAVPDLGLAGAALATEDNRTTGRFLGQEFSTEAVVSTPEGAAAALEALLGQGVRFVVTLADAGQTLALADQAGDRALLFNAADPSDRLRGTDCRANLLHTAPSDAMLADAVAQFLAWKRWDRWLMVAGSHPEDQALAAAYRRAAAKFGARIVAERLYEDTGGARRTDTGLVQVQQQMPALTQRSPEHDVVVAADHAGVFADYLPYHTWEARPVAGSAGLVPTSWHPAHEAWGATQFQTRFEALTHRTARPEDYQAWVAIRALGEAASRSRSADFATLSAYIRGPAFQLAAFKGQALSFRPWDGQLRQPILLSSGPITASVSPQPAFLHQVSALDTLGIDRPETQCTRMPGQGE